MHIPENALKINITPTKNWAREKLEASYIIGAGNKNKDVVNLTILSVLFLVS